MPKLDTGNTAWMLAATALVLLMTPGLAFFYGGMVRSKNVLAMLMQNFVCMGIVSVLWVFDLFSLAFGPDKLGGLIGSGAQYAGMRHGSDLWRSGVPTTVIATFQITFAIITAALITGAVADRLKFAPFVVFTTAWSILVYAPIAHWVWGGGWLRSAPRRGLRRWHRRPHQRRYGGHSAHHGAGQTARLAEGADAPAQRAVRAARCRPLVVRLDRLQRGQ